MTNAERANITYEIIQLRKECKKKKGIIERREIVQYIGESKEKVRRRGSGRK